MAASCHRRFGMAADGRVSRQAKGACQARDRLRRLGATRELTSANLLVTSITKVRVSVDIRSLLERSETR
jgi:hypothetical protein